MNYKYAAKILTLTITALTLTTQLPDVKGAERVVAIQGEITQVNDDLNWFNDSIQIGMAVAGTYNFFDAGFEVAVAFNNPLNDKSYSFKFQPGNPPSQPVLPVALQLDLGGFSYHTGGFGSYTVGVVNDSDGSIWPVGDRLTVQSPLAYPAHFQDFTGDPVIDPDGFLFPIVQAFIEFQDPSNTAFNSADLPLGAPSLASFSTAHGFLIIADGNGEPDYAVAEFKITSVRAVPEPSSVLLITSLTLLSSFRRQSRTRNNTK